MQFHEESNKDHPVIKQYEPGRLLIDTTWYSEPLFILPDQVISAPSLSKDNLTLADFHPIKDKTLDILLIGTGETILPLSPTLLTEWANQRISVEVMGTRAACRTYLILLAEERQIGALLFP